MATPANQAAAITLGTTIGTAFAAQSGNMEDLRNFIMSPALLPDAAFFRDQLTAGIAQAISAALVAGGVTLATDNGRMMRAIAHYIGDGSPRLKNGVGSFGTFNAGTY